MKTWKKQKTNKLFSEFTHQQAGTRQLQYGLLRVSGKIHREATEARATEVCEAKLHWRVSSSLSTSALLKLEAHYQIFPLFLTIHFIYLNTQRINENIKTWKWTLTGQSVIFVHCNGFKINRYDFKTHSSQITFHVLVFIFVVKSCVISYTTVNYALNVYLVWTSSRLKDSW